MKKLVSVAVVAALAFVLSSCFVIQGFIVGPGAITPGSSTKAILTLRPASTSPDSERQFVVLGVDDSDLAMGKGTWGANGLFGGPFTMGTEPGFAAVLAGEGCSSNGLDFASITGMTWKTYLTPAKVRDKGLVDKKAVVEMLVKAKATASSDTLHVLFVVTGIYDDSNDDGIVDSADAFLCGGLSSASLYVK